MLIMYSAILLYDYLDYEMFCIIRKFISVIVLDINRDCNGMITTNYVENAKIKRKMMQLHRAFFYLRMQLLMFVVIPT